MSIFSKIKGSISKIATKIESKLKGSFNRKNEYIIPETKTISDKKLPEIGEGVDIPETSKKAEWVKFRLYSGKWYSIPYIKGMDIEESIIDTINSWMDDSNYEIDLTIDLMEVLIVLPDKSYIMTRLTQKYWEKYVL